MAGNVEINHNTCLWIPELYFRTKKVIHISKENVELIHSHEVNKVKSKYNNIIIFTQESIKYSY